MGADATTGAVETNVYPDYAVVVIRRGPLYELRIRELLLKVHGPDFHGAYKELARRKQEVIGWARSLDAMDDLPLPEPLPPIGADGSSGAVGSRVIRALRRLWHRLF